MSHKTFIFARVKQPLTMWRRPFLVAKVILRFIRVVDAWSQGIKHSGPSQPQQSCFHQQVTQLWPAKFKGNSAEGFLGKMFFPGRREACKKAPFYLSLPFLFWFLWWEAWGLKLMWSPWDYENYTNYYQTMVMNHSGLFHPQIYYYLAVKYPYWLATVSWVFCHLHPKLFLIH